VRVTVRSKAPDVKGTARARSARAKRAPASRECAGSATEKIFFPRAGRVRRQCRDARDTPNAAHATPRARKSRLFRSGSGVAPFARIQGPFETSTPGQEDSQCDES